MRQRLFGGVRQLHSARQKLFSGIKVHGSLLNTVNDESKTTVEVEDNSDENSETGSFDVESAVSIAEEDIASLFNVEKDPRVAQLYAITKRWATGTTVTAGSVISYVTTMIGIVQRLFTEPSTGAYKEEVLVSVLSLVLENEVHWENETAKQAVLALMQSTVPVMVRTAIRIAKGEINLGMMLKNCFPCCFGVKE